MPMDHDARLVLANQLVIMGALRLLLSAQWSGPHGSNAEELQMSRLDARMQETRIRLE